MSLNRQLFLKHQAQTTHFPLMFEVSRAEGNFIYDMQGKPHLDLIGGISVCALGHNNENVKKAVIAQVEKHMHVMVYGEFIQETQTKLATKLCSFLPAELNSVYLLNSGAEATDVALKLAKRVTARPNIIANFNSYHGSTHAALSLNSDEYYKNKFRPLLPAVTFIGFNQTTDLEKITEQTACVVTEVIQGEAGYLPASREFLTKLRNRCNETGSLLIFDEIQTGIGKTGKMFAFEHYAVVPDILLLGKALGAGMPIGAVVASQELMSKLADEPILGHITTFGGHPVVAAAALAGLNEIENQDLLSSIGWKNELFLKNLEHSLIYNITGKGLMLGLQLKSFEQVLSLVQRCLNDGLIIDWFLFANNKLRIAPPLTITKDQIIFACDTIKKNLY